LINSWFSGKIGIVVWPILRDEFGLLRSTPSGCPAAPGAGGTYTVYIPDPLVTRTFSLGGIGAADAVDLATRARDYVEGLTATRYNGSPDSQEARDGLNLWLGTFASASTRAAADATAFEKRIRTIQGGWRTRLAAVRKHSVTLRIIDRLPGTPVITIAEAQKLTGASSSSVNDAIKKLEEAGIIAPTVAGRARKQVYEATEVVDAFSNLERQRASPVGDTDIEKPVRTVPALSRRSR
jgi:DNA-binding Lrp family transcriptional regulator